MKRRTAPAGHAHHHQSLHNKNNYMYDSDEEALGYQMDMGIYIAGQKEVYKGR